MYGLIEVHGTVNERNNVVCHNYVLLGADAAKTFGKTCWLVADFYEYTPAK